MPKQTQKSAQSAYKKLNIFTMGGKGGTGKTTFAEWFYYNNIPVVLRDLDVENRSKGGLQHYYKEAVKINVNAREALDVFFDVGDFDESVVISDMGAGQGEAAMRWFSAASKEARTLGIGFVLVGVVNDDPASVDSVLQWAKELQGKVRYWIVLNEMHDEEAQFGYWHNSENVQSFCAAFKPIVTKLASRTLKLQGPIADHGLSLHAVINGENDVAELQQTRAVLRALLYRNQAFEEFDRVVPDLLPEV